MQHDHLSWKGPLRSWSPMGKLITIHTINKYLDLGDMLFTTVHRTEIQ